MTFGVFIEIMLLFCLSVFMVIQTIIGNEKYWEVYSM